MAKGTAGKSASGAAMSKYDVEVEARLQALEKAVVELKEHSHNSSNTSDASDHDRIVELERLVNRLRT